MAAVENDEITVDDGVVNVSDDVLALLKRNMATLMMI